MPQVSDSAPTQVTSSSVTLNASVNPTNQLTSYWFNYGPTQSLGTSSQAASASGGTWVNASLSLSGLTVGTSVYYQFVSGSSTASASGAVRVFTPVDGFIDGVTSDFGAWLSQDALNLLSAYSQMFQQVFSIVNEQGSLDDPATWVPAWSTLLDVDNCPTQLLPFLSMFNGTGVQPGVADGIARSQIRYESSFKRGQGYAGNYTTQNGPAGGAIVLAAQKYLTGTQIVTLIERTNPVGNPDPYWFQLIVQSSQLVSAPLLTAAVNAVKPGGVQWTLTVTNAWTISQMEAAGYASLSALEATFPTINNLEANVA